MSAFLEDPTTDQKATCIISHCLAGYAMKFRNCAKKVVTLDPVYLKLNGKTPHKIR